MHHRRERVLKNLGNRSGSKRNLAPGLSTWPSVIVSNVSCYYPPVTRRQSRSIKAESFLRLLAILMHGAMPPATTYIWRLGPGSRNLNFSPTPRPNLNFKAVPSSTHRVLQLWSNRTWSTWLLFWSRKWPSEASNHHFSPLRGLGEGCALWGARKSSLTWGAARQKRRFF